MTSNELLNKSASIGGFFVASKQLTLQVVLYKVNKPKLKGGIMAQGREIGHEYTVERENRGEQFPHHFRVHSHNEDGTVNVRFRHRPHEICSRGSDEICEAEKAGLIMKQR